MKIGQVSQGFLGVGYRPMWWVTRDAMFQEVQCCTVVILSQQG